MARVLHRLFSIFCLALFGGTGFAWEDASPQDAGLRTLSIEELMGVEIMSASKYRQRLEDAPAFVTVVSAQQIRDRGYTDLLDVLRDIPGVDYVDHARGFGEFFTLRGIEGNDRFLVFVDGQRINPTSGTALSVGNSIPIVFAERIEILLGPASALYGADAFSGIIHIYTSDEDDSRSFRAQARAGSEQSRDRAMWLRFRGTKGLSLTFQAREYQSDGPDFLDQDPIFDSIHDYPAPLTPAFQQPIDDHGLTLQASYRDFRFSYFRRQFDEGNAFGQQPRSNIYNRENRWKTVTDLLHTDYRYLPSSGGVVSFSLAYVHHEQDPLTQFMKTREPFAFDRIFNQYMTGDDRTWRGEVSYHRRASDRLSFITGAELEYTTSIPPYANDQVLGYSAAYCGDAARQIRDQLTLHETRSALYAQATFQPAETLDLILGGRVDHSSRHDFAFNPRVGFIYRPRDATTIKAFFGTAFQAPSLFFQYEQWGSVNAVMLSVDELQATHPGWKLDNQRTRSLELTWSQRLSAHFRFRCSAYHHELNDLIERVVYTDHAYNKYFSTPDQPVYSLGFRNENVGEQSIDGADLQFTLMAGDRFSAHAWVSVIRAMSESDGQETPIPRIAETKFGVMTTAQDLWGWLTLFARYRWVGPVNNRNQEAFPDGTQPGYHETGIHALGRIREHALISLRVDNVLDRDIQHGGLYDQVVYLPTSQQPGRQFSIGFEYAF